MNINPTELKSFVQDNPKLVTRKQSTKYPNLFVLKYTRKVFYDNLWNTNPLLKECRGLVVDENYNVVCRPFSKIFNFKENDSGLNWSMNDRVKVVRKVNGFMAGLTKYNDELIISTTGSLDSEYIEYARKYLCHIDKDSIDAGFTYMFEICHEDDPHIIEEDIGSHFLGIVDHIDGFVIYNSGSRHEDGINGMIMKFLHYYPYFDIDPIPNMYFSNLLELVELCKHEGFIVVNENHNPYETIKIKSPYYLVAKFFARVGTDKLISGITSGNILSRIDEEYYPLVKMVQDYGIENFSNLAEQDRIKLINSWIWVL